MDYLKRLFSNKDLLKKIFFVLALLAVYRLIAHIPIPGPDSAAVREFMTSTFSSNTVLSFLDVFSGGSISRFSLAMLAVGPYTTASIMMQLLTIVVPKLESLSKEGEQGRNKINQYSRIVAILVAPIEGYGTIRLLQSAANVDFLSNLTIMQWAIMLISTTATTIFLMWLGELITEKGIGNGVSIIIFAGIVASIPTVAGNTFQKLFVGQFEFMQLLTTLVTLIMLVAVIALIVFITEAQRKIPVSYAKKVRGDKLYGGIDSFLPMKLNMSGVIPIIFASAFMNVPTIIGFLAGAKTAWIANFATWMQNTFTQYSYPYAIALFVLVFVFTFFSTFLYFKPKDVSENLQKQGGFVPGFRPGTQTEKYLNYLINRVTLWGAIFLSLIAVLPTILYLIIGEQSITVGGTGLLIVVGVAIEMKNRLEAQMVLRSYEDF